MYNCVLRMNVICICFRSFVYFLMTASHYKRVFSHLSTVLSQGPLQELIVSLTLAYPFGWVEFPSLSQIPPTFSVKVSLGV